ncbi:isochorismatase family protein [Tabrizicola sp. WMC-M-20]|nr:isochorismatase family protein [Tabrizicola sp. WMC-M-20]
MSRAASRNECRDPSSTEPIDTLLCAGTKTKVCCESTARDAMMMHFGVVMVSNAGRCPRLRFCLLRLSRYLSNKLSADFMRRL